MSRAAFWVLVASLACSALAEPIGPCVSLACGQPIRVLRGTPNNWVPPPPTFHRPPSHLTKIILASGKKQPREWVTPDHTTTESSSHAESSSEGALSEYERVESTSHHHGHHNYRIGPDGEREVKAIVVPKAPMYGPYAYPNNGNAAVPSSTPAAPNAPPNPTSPPATVVPAPSPPASPTTVPSSSVTAAVAPASSPATAPTASVRFISRRLPDNIVSTDTNRVSKAEINRAYTHPHTLANSAPPPPNGLNLKPGTPAARVGSLGPNGKRIIAPVETITPVYREAVPHPEDETMLNGGEIKPATYSRYRQPCDTCPERTLQPSAVNPCTGVSC